MSERVFRARWPFQYDDDVELERGQLFNLRGHLNDDRLLRIGYIEEFFGKHPIQCRVCGKHFSTEGFLNLHGNKAHSEYANRNDLSPVAVGHDGAFVSGVDLAYEQEMQQLQKDEPLYLDKTAAERAPSEAPIRKRVRKKGGWPKGKPRGNKGRPVLAHATG